MARKLTHVDRDGRSRMVDVGEKPDTVRTAVAECLVELSSKTYKLLTDNALPKGDALNTARIAGIMAAKKTHDLIPLCHPLPITFADVTFETNDAASNIRVIAEVRCTGKTGVEMEALTACQVAALTVYDMVKAVQKDVVVTGCRLVYKSGGKSGEYRAK